PGRVEGDAVFGTRQHLAEAAEVDPPRARCAQPGLELGADACLPTATAPAVARYPALKTEAAGEPFRWLGHIAVPRDVKAVRPPAAVISVSEATVGSAGTHPADMVHQIASDRIGPIGEAVGEFLRLR